MSNLAADKVLRVNCPGFGVSSTLPLGEAKPLAMYDVIVVNPSSIVHLFEPKSDVARQIDKILADGGSTLKLENDSTLESISAELELREHELRQFLSKGGLLIYFLAAPFIVDGPEQSMDNYIWLYEWSPDKTNGSDRTMAANKGRGAELSTRGKHHPFGPYIQQMGMEWSTVIRTENLSDGYNTIANAGQSKSIAGYKSSGPRRGQVLFLPAPYESRFDDTLKDCILKWHEIHNGPDADKPEPNFEEEVSVSYDSEPDVEGETLLNDLFSEESVSTGRKKSSSTIDWPEFDNDVPPFQKERMADDLDAKLDALDPKGGRTFSKDEYELSKSGQQNNTLMDKNTLDNDLDAQFAQFEGKPKASVESTFEEPKSKADFDRFEEPIRSRTDADRFEEPIRSRTDLDRFDEPIKRAEDRFEEPIKRAEDRFEEPIKRAEDRFEEPIKRAEDRFEEPIRRAEDRFEEPIRRAEDRFEEPIRQQKVEQDRFEQQEKESKKPTRDDDFDLDTMLEAKPKRVAEPAPAMEVHAATVSIPEAKDLMSRMEHELSVPGGAPEWCGKVSFSELQDMQQQLDHLNETVRKAKIKIADIEERIRKLGEIKDALLSATGHRLHNSCAKVFELLGWNTEPSMDESKEIFLKDGDKVQAIVRIVYTTGQPNRSELAELSQSVISYWDKTDIEPKGILLASTYADRHPRERDEEDFTTSIQDFARRKNLCLVNALQLLTMYREVALRDGDATRIRESILTTNGLVNGFRLQFSEPAGAART